MLNTRTLSGAGEPGLPAGIIVELDDTEKRLAELEQALETLCSKLKPVMSDGPRPTSATGSPSPAPAGPSPVRSRIIALNQRISDYHRGIAELTDRIEL